MEYLFASLVLLGVFALPAMGIAAAQKNIQEIPQARPEYVVNTSEFIDVKTCLVAIEGRRKPDVKDNNRPTLKRRD